jgi:hypothetical protein
VVVSLHRVSRYPVLYVSCDERKLAENCHTSVFVARSHDKTTSSVLSGLILNLMIRLLALENWHFPEDGRQSRSETKVPLEAPAGYRL